VKSNLSCVIFTVKCDFSQFEKREKHMLRRVRDYTLSSLSLFIRFISSAVKEYMIPIAAKLSIVGLARSSLHNDTMAGDYLGS